MIVNLLILTCVAGAVIVAVIFIACGITRCPKCGDWHEPEDPCP
jgi:hypothetical protein